MGEQNKVVRRKCKKQFRKIVKIIGSDNINDVTVKIDMIQGDGEKHEIWLKGLS